MLHIVSSVTQVPNQSDIDETTKLTDAMVYAKRNIKEVK